MKVEEERPDSELSPRCTHIRRAFGAFYERHFPVATPFLLGRQGRARTRAHQASWSLGCGKVRSPPPVFSAVSFPGAGSSLDGGRRLQARPQLSDPDATPKSQSRNRWEVRIGGWRWFPEPEPLYLLTPRERRAPVRRPRFICVDFYRASVFTDLRRCASAIGPHEVAQTARGDGGAA